MTTFAVADGPAGADRVDAMDALRDYQGRRLDLGDMIRAILHITRGYHDAEREEQVRQLLARLASGRFRLAVVGQFSRGKTTLMNALLGAAYLPMGALPMTSVVTTVRYGSRPRATVRRRGSPLPVEVPLTEVAPFVARASAERSELQVSSVEVEVPAEILRLGFEFADTPGIGSAMEASTAITARFLPRADAVIVVTGFDSPLTQAEGDFLALASEHAGKLFVVINKRDLVSARDAAEVAAYVRQWLAEHLRLPAAQVFGLSALQALEATAAGDHRRLADSGVLEFQATLADFLAANTAPVYLRNIAARAASLAAGQGRDLRLGRLADDAGPDPDQVAAAFDARMDELRAQQRALARRIAARVQDGLPDLLADRRSAWQASLRELIASRAEHAPSGNAGPGPAGGPEAMLAALEQAGREGAGEWLDRRAAEVHELLIGLAAADIGALLELARSPRALGAEIAGLAGQRSGPVAWCLEDVPDLAAPRIDWLVPAPSRRRSHRRRATADEGRVLLADVLGTAVSGFVDRAREAFQAAAGEWTDRLAGQAERQATEAASQFRRYLHTAPREEDLVALDDLGSRLADFQASLDTWTAATGELVARASVAASAEDTGSCPVCRTLEAALSEHLRRDQFLLATREQDQARHARAGGFCPMHTWQYAAMASPLGIAAGYARLAGDVAGALEDMGGASAEAGRLAGRVAGLMRASACPVCAVLAQCETSEVARLASPGSATADPAALCLRHLALVLNAGPAPGDGQAMVRSLAVALRRAAEDMREYALKREARHSGLVTEEESRAHSDAVRLLAGQPALARPWDSQTRGR